MGKSLFALDSRRINFQPYYPYMHQSFRIHWMLGNIALDNVIDEFFARILRHALRVGQPCRAEPRRKSFGARVSRVLWRELDAARVETKARQPFFVFLRAMEKIRRFHF